MDALFLISLYQRSRIQGMPLEMATHNHRLWAWNRPEFYGDVLEGTSEIF